jgi:hypothetical protein
LIRRWHHSNWLLLQPPSFRQNTCAIQNIEPSIGAFPDWYLSQEDLPWEGEAGLRPRSSCLPISFVAARGVRRKT